MHCGGISWTRPEQMTPKLEKRFFWLDVAQKVGAAVGVTAFFASFIVVGVTGSCPAFLSLFLGGPALGVAALGIAFLRGWQQDVHNVSEETENMRFSPQDIFQRFFLQS